MTKSEIEGVVKYLIQVIQTDENEFKRQDAMMEILDMFDPFRRSLAKKFAGKGVEFDDVCQVIDLKLIEAMHDYNEALDNSAIRHITSKSRNGIFNYYKKEMNYFKEDRKMVSIDQPVFYISHNGHNMLMENSNILDYYLEDNFDEDFIIDKIMIEEGLSNLTGHQKELISMYYLSDMKQEEIAEELNINQANVSRATKRGVKKLRESLNPLDGNDDMF